MFREFIIIQTIKLIEFIVNCKYLLRVHKIVSYVYSKYCGFRIQQSLPEDNEEITSRIMKSIRDNDTLSRRRDVDENTDYQYNDTFTRRREVDENTDSHYNDKLTRKTRPSTGLKGNTLFTNSITENIIKYKKLREASQNCIFSNLNLVFICDGNRRWARQNDMEINIGTIKKGGILKFVEITDFCYSHNFSSVSFYVLAQRNLQRKGEIDEILKYVENIVALESLVRIRFYGNFDVLESEKLKNKIYQIEELSWGKGNNDYYDNTFVINIFFAYNSSVCDKDPGNERRYFNGKVDMVIRTSGERRLSDFMTKQVASGTPVEFISSYWPDLQISQIYLVLLKYILEEKYLRND